MDQRRVDAFVDVFTRIRDGQPLPGVPVRRERELALVVHADTFFGDGPAANDPGETRGPGGVPAPVDPVTAREQAHASAATGATNVLLVDTTGTLHRMVRLPTAPAGGWTRQLLDQALAARLDSCRRCRTDRMRRRWRSPSTCGRNPRCTAYDCPRRAHRCDLDHDVPWPRGPTEVDNLAPRHRRHHELKTRGLIRTRLNQDGSVEHTMLTGLASPPGPNRYPATHPAKATDLAKATDHETAACA